MSRTLGYPLDLRVSQSYSQAMTLTTDDPRHGTLTAYNYHRCRCPLCVGAWREKNRRELAARLEKGLAPDDPRHGTNNAYGNFRCRCDPCRKAHSDQLKIQRGDSRRTDRGVKRSWSINDIIPDDLKVTQDATGYSDRTGVTP